MRRHDFGFGRDYAYQQEQARALEDAVQMQALAVAGQYRDTRFHNLLRPEPLGIADTIHAAASLANGPLALGYGSRRQQGLAAAALTGTTCRVRRAVERPTARIHQAASSPTRCSWP
jgi:hypothetical protein